MPRGPAIALRIISAPGHERFVRNLLAGTSLRGARTLPVSAVTGEGIEPLRDELAAAASDFRRDATDGKRMRYAVDRAFTVTGSVTVVTGTVFDGSVRLGDRLVLSPAGREVRVRGTQQDGDEFIGVARGVAQAAPGGRFTAGRFRDDAGVGRALAVQVLEALDRLGVTQRVADVRVLRATPPPASPQQGDRSP